MNNWSTYFTNKVKKSKDDPKALFKFTRNMIGNSGDKILPVHTCKRKLTNDFSCTRTCVCGCDCDVVCVGHDLNRCTGWW